MRELLRSIIYVAICGLISFYVGALLPRKWFLDNKFPFSSFCWEKNGKIYDKIHIKKWKSEIIDMSKIMTNILPKKVATSAGVRDIELLIKETCVAEVVHYFLCIISCANIWIWEKQFEGFLIWILCIIGNLPFILVQRYNRPNLQRLKEKMIKREKTASEV